MSRHTWSTATPIIPAANPKAPPSELPLNPSYNSLHYLLIISPLLLCVPLNRAADEDKIEVDVQIDGRVDGEDQPEAKLMSV